MLKTSPDDKTMKLWDRASGALLYSFSSDTIPLPFEMMFLKNCSNTPNFVCSKNFTGSETQLYCKNMILISPIDLSINNANVFLDKHAIIRLISPHSIKQTVLPNNDPKLSSIIPCLPHS